MDILTYSLNFNDKFGFESEKIYNYIIQTGGSNIYSFMLNLVLSIIIIAISVILYYQSTLVTKTSALILNIQHNDTYNTLILEYTIHNKSYTNKINIAENKYRIGDIVDILYENTNHNVIKLYLIDIFIISIILLLLGLWMIYNSFGNNNDNNNNDNNNNNNSNITFFDNIQSLNYE